MNTSLLSVVALLGLLAGAQACATPWGGLHRSLLQINGTDSGLTEQQQKCFDAAQDLNLDAGTARVCGECFTDVFPQDMEQFQNPKTADLDAFFRKIVEDKTLAGCCGFGCGDIIQQYVELVEGPCSFSSPAALVDILKRIQNALSETCASVPPPPNDPYCRPAREDAPEEGDIELCVIHNDPHVVKFGASYSSMITCDVTGTVTLLDNDYIKVTAQADAIAEPQAFQGASVLTSVSVAYKNASCDTQGIAITGATTRQTWRDARINTAVIIRSYTMTFPSGKTQPYLTVLITTPWTGKGSICVDGCPGSEVTLSTLLSNSNATRRSLLVTQEQARAACTEGAGVNYGEYEEDAIQACIVDSLASGDTTSFSLSSKLVAKETQAEQDNIEKDNDEFKASDGGGGGNAGEPDSASLAKVSYMAFALLAAAAGAAVHAAL